MGNNTKQKIKRKTMLLVKNVYNWFEIKYMKMRGYSPTTFNPFINKYEYELKSEVDKLEKWEEEPFEIYAYDVDNIHLTWWYHNDKDKSKTQKCKSLRQGDCIDKPLFTRNTE